MKSVGDLGPELVDSMFLGVDIGTSSVKAVLIDEDAKPVADSESPLTVLRPHPRWSEQNPDAWVKSADIAVRMLPADLRRGVKGIGLSGQMHGATLVGANDRPLCPAILWNDGRSDLECKELERKVKNLREITGNKAMPGFTAPKLLWIQKNRPELFAEISKILLPKDYLRLAWTGEYATDPSDASGTLWLDVGNRRWNDATLEATGLDVSAMPDLYEGPDVTGELKRDVADHLGLPVVPVIAGAGDQAAGAIGAGVTQIGDTAISLGTSGVLFSVSDGFRPNAEEATHAFCHALPHTWHQMGVLLSAASAVDAASSMAGFRNPEEAYAAAAAHGSSNDVLFLPYLTGERTPHDDPYARGCFFGLTPDTSPASLVHAALEGVAFAFLDAQDAMARSGNRIEIATVIGGGSQSRYWGEILASVLNLTLIYRTDAKNGPAHGVAKLARYACGNDQSPDAFAPPPVLDIVRPDAAKAAQYRTQISLWRELYQSTKHIFRERLAE